MERHNLETEARGIPAVTATTVRVTQPWTSSRTKAKRERAAARDRWTALGLDGIAYIPKAVVTGTGKAVRPKQRKAANPVKVIYMPKIDHDYTQG